MSKQGQKRRRRLHGWNIGYYVREGFVGIFRHGLMSFAAVCMIVACLLIMGTFSLVAVNLDANRRQMEQENEMLAYVDETLSTDDARALEAGLKSLPNVRDAIFVDREEVLEQFRADRPNENGLFDLLPETTFRHRYRVFVNDIELLADTSERVRGMDGIADVSVGLEIAQGMVTVRNVSAGIAVVLAGMLALVSLFIIANTLRLAAFYRRDEIAIMKMCGATNSFIRWPFVTEGALLGLFSAVLTFFLQWSVYDLLAQSVTSGSQLGFLVVLPFESLWQPVLGVFCGAGVVIGVFGSLLAIGKFLKV